MRKKEELKTERKTVLMTKALAEDIEQEAQKRGIKPNAVMNERLMHSGKSIPPSDMVQFQEFVNTACKVLEMYSETDAKTLERKIMDILKVKRFTDDDDSYLNNAIEYCFKEKFEPGEKLIETVGYGVSDRNPITAFKQMYAIKELFGKDQG